MILFFPTYFAWGQVGIGHRPDTSAVLDLGYEQGHYKGVLLPRVNFSDLSVIQTQTSVLPHGLTFFDEQFNSLIYYHKTKDRFFLMNPWTTPYPEDETVPYEISTKANVTIEGDVKVTRIEGEFTVPPGGVIMFTSQRMDTCFNLSTGMGLVGTRYEGWAICDGQNNTPDLRGRFVVGMSDTNTSDTEYSNSAKNDTDYASIGAHGGEKAHQLLLSEMPSHVHTGTTDNDGSHTHKFDDAYFLEHQGQTNLYGEELIIGSEANGYRGSNSLDNNNNALWYRDHTTKAENSAHQHDFTTNSAGGDNSHENRPPYYVLAFIMKLP